MGICWIKKRFKSHGVHITEQIRVPLWLASFAADDRFLRASRAAYKKTAYHLVPSGGLVSDESVHERPGSPDTPYEYCTVAELTMSFLSALEKTRHAFFADHIEKMAFNGGQGARLPDLRALSYLTTDNRRETPVAKFGGRYGYAAVHNAAACCTLQAGRLMPFYVSGMWMRDTQTGEPVAQLFGECSLGAIVNGIPVVIREHADYPFSDEIVFEIEPKEPVDCAIWLRKPDWSDPAITAPGASIIERDGYLGVRKRWTAGDAIHFMLRPGIERRATIAGETYLSRGPLLYALPLPLKKDSEIEIGATGFYKCQYSCADETGWDYRLTKNASFTAAVKSCNQRHPWDTAGLALSGTLKDAKGRSHSVELAPIGSTLYRRLSFKP